MKEWYISKEGEGYMVKETKYLVWLKMENGDVIRYKKNQLMKTR